MPTLDQWQYLHLPKRGLVVNGILSDDSRSQLNNGKRICTSTVTGVEIRGDHPVAVTKSGTAYTLLEQAPISKNPTARS